jgi:hypothetical protein
MKDLRTREDLLKSGLLILELRLDIVLPEEQLCSGQYQLLRSWAALHSGR